MNHGEVYFTVFGDEFDPNELTGAIGIEPAAVRIKASHNPKFTSWKLSTGKVSAEVIDVYEMAGQVIDRLAPKAKEIAAFIQGHNLSASLNVVLTISFDEQLSTPAIGLTESMIRFLAEVGAAIDVDTYRG